MIFFINTSSFRASRGAEISEEKKNYIAKKNLLIECM